MHCYNVQLNESCCTDGTGNSCDAGYYCAADTSSRTWCCPEGMDVDTCASTYQVTGSLTSDAPYVSTSTSTSSSSSSTLVASSSASPSASHASSHASSVASSSSGSSPLATGAVFFETGNSTAAGVAAGSGARVGTGATATVSSQDAATSAASATGSSTTSGVSTSGASSASPATFLALFAAAALAAFF